MTPRRRRRLRAQASLERIAFEIAELDPRAAARFIEAVEESLELLSEMPEVGVRFETDDPMLAHRVRKWVIPRFRRYLIFYFVEADVVHFIALIDGRSDYVVTDERHDFEE